MSCSTTGFIFIDCAIARTSAVVAILFWTQFVLDHSLQSVYERSKLLTGQIQLVLQIIRDAEGQKAVWFGPDHELCDDVDCLFQKEFIVDVVDRQNAANHEKQGDQSGLGDGGIQTKLLRNCEELVDQSV